MITIVLTNRNRDSRLIKRCLKSLENQSNTDFHCVIVDYGSSEKQLKDLEIFIKDFKHINLISCETSEQLWCKSRAINIALQSCNTSYFFVGDIDMIYHPDFIETLNQYQTKADATYFQVGFLSEEESKKEKVFNEFEINFKSTREATGMTLYNTNVLKHINGYDEFYHGWGSEDTDVHIRLKNANKQVFYYEKSVLILHQWHPKIYRSTSSLEPFHSKLETINQKYLEFTKRSGNTKANQNQNWGYYKPEDYKKLKGVEVVFNITNELSEVKGLLSNLLMYSSNKVVSISVKKHPEYKSIKHVAKKVLDKKVKTFLDMQEVNDLLLECIILNFRNAPYQYNFDSSSQNISLIIKL
ncbi:glycosyltransferase [uncultured Algibacter sp.]|uniref:glycosyltransferase family 2 protein n=1 Tax=uncultured Algibacter sp. TaxID=298659 RepID=UPI0026158D55|nr:glycosyltransferase [uncultured Algibacter sp.]